MAGNKQKKRVVVALSGGVDSSVAAALLQQEGYEVIGAFIKVWQPDFLACTWREDRLDAMRVCAHLGIPFYTYDLSEAYKRDVVDYMIAEYQAGRTPNPDVMCNTKIKFGAFLSRALADKADYVATGHYVRREQTLGGYALRTAIDANKDQSYFLWGVPKHVLSKILFPIGKYTKPEVRRLARQHGLPTAAKKDSQGLCFLGKLDIRTFLSQFLPKQPGAVLDGSGTVVGEHIGAAFYTIGQRHGFQHNTGGKAVYVSEKDVAGNTLTVTPTLFTSTETSERCRVQITDTNWIVAAPRRGAVLSGRVRYRQPLVPCTVLEKNGERTVVQFSQNVVAPEGQSLVLYDENGYLVGGGVIAALV